MTFIFLVLIFTLVLALLLAIELLRTDNPPEQFPDEVQANSGADSYAALSRLFHSDEADYLADRPDLQRQMRRARRSVSRKYLRQLRAEFMQVFNICRLLAPVSKDPQFVFGLAKQLYRFHAAYLDLRIRTELGLSWSGAGQTADRLVACVHGVRERALAMVQAERSAISEV